MTIRKIADIDEKFTCCKHPEHLPPAHIYLSNGVYEHTCPGCGNKTIFTINNPTFENYQWRV